MVGDDPDADDIETLRQAIVRLALEALEEQPNRALPVEIRPEALEQLVARWRTEIATLDKAVKDGATMSAEKWRAVIEPLQRSVSGTNDKLDALEHGQQEQSRQLAEIQNALIKLAKASGAKIKISKIPPRGRHHARSEDQRNAEEFDGFWGYLGKGVKSKILWITAGLLAFVLGLLWVTGIWSPEGRPDPEPAYRKSILPPLETVDPGNDAEENEIDPAQDPLADVMAPGETPLP